MIQVLLFLVYLHNGQPKLETAWLPSVEECADAGEARIEALYKELGDQIVGVTAGCKVVDTSKTHKES